MLNGTYTASITLRLTSNGFSTATGIASVTKKKLVDSCSHSVGSLGSHICSSAYYSTTAGCYLYKTPYIQITGTDSFTAVFQIQPSEYSTHGGQPSASWGNFGSGTTIYVYYNNGQVTYSGGAASGVVDNQWINIECIGATASIN